jgi:formylglycine-generating enzyme required for sulfatase activity
MRSRDHRSFIALAGALLALAAALAGAPSGAQAKRKACPEGMVPVDNRFCIDRFEASLEQVLPGGDRRRHSPYAPIAGKKVKAVSKRGVVPQGYISRDEAAAACKSARKRLCSDEEWMTACRGKRPTTYPYGDDHRPGVCNDRGISSFNKYYGPSEGGEAPLEAYTWDNMNDPRLNRLEGTVAPAGTFKRCRSSWNVYDMVGNLHEWTAAEKGTFRGGYYLDTQINGTGCDYKTTAHSSKYRDYSTGFRCCK